MMRNLINKLKSFKGIVFLSARFNETRVLNCLLLALCVKFIYLIWQANEYALLLYPGCHLALVNGDALEYISSAQNLLINGIYYPDVRMPGYPLLLTGFLYLLKLPAALDSVVIFQTLLSAVSVFYLAKTAFLVSRSRMAFLLAFFVYLVSTYVSVYDKYILTESVSMSLLVFSVYMFTRVFSGDVKKGPLLLSGLFAALAVFMRPALFIIFLSYGFFLAIAFLRKRMQLRQMLSTGLWLALSFLVFDSMWIRRNYEWHGEFIPLMSFKLYNAQVKNSYYTEEARFVQAWGGDIVHWEPDAEIRWFGCGRRFEADSRVQLPSYIYTNAYNADSLLRLRSDMRRFDVTNDPVLKKSICARLERYRAAFIAEKKLTYVLLPFRYMYKLVLNGGGTFNLYSRSFFQLKPSEKVIKLGMTALYELLAIWGCIFAFIGLFRRRAQPIGGFLSFFIVANIVLVAFGFRMCEYRYFVPDYPFCIVLIAAAVPHLYSRSLVSKERIMTNAANS